MLENDIRHAVQTALDEDLGHTAHNTIHDMLNADITAQLIPAAKNLKKPQKEVDKKMKELGYHVHVPKRPRASAARNILNRMKEL